MLNIVGLGLNPKKHLTLEAMERIDESSTIFMENYTSRIVDMDKESLENLIKKDIEILEREDVEEGKKIIEKAKESIVSLLVPGDPMIATTHVSLVLMAKDSGIPVNIVNGISIQTVIPSILGIQSYKFGRTVTIPLPEYDFYPESVYRYIEKNIENGLHTIVLLDIRKDLEMHAIMALDILEKMESLYHSDVINEDRIIAVISKACSEKMKVNVDKFSRIRERDLGEPLHTIVILGNLHFMEREALRKIASMPDDI